MKIFKWYITRKELLLGIKNTCILICASFILAFATGVFLVPLNIVAGGLSGIAIIINNYIPNSVDISVAIMSWSLFAIGLFILGKKFALKTLVCTIFYPIFLVLILRISVFTEIANQLATNAGVAEYLIGGITGGVLTGIGVALSFVAGGSTGGVDILVFIIKKYIKIFKESTVSFLIDATVIVLAIIIFWDPDPNNSYFARCLINIFSAFICAAMIELIYISKNNSVEAEIISEKRKEINDYIQIELGRGSSIVEIKGGYNGENRTLLKATFSKNEYYKIKEIINEIDPKAFATFTITHSVFGNGFTRNNPDDIEKK